ncbi:zinc-ribbon domain-containing protein [Mycobacterium pinniadriaticum]
MSYASGKRVWWLCPSCDLEWQGVTYPREPAAAPWCPNRCHRQ